MKTCQRCKKEYDDEFFINEKNINCTKCLVCREYIKEYNQLNKENISERRKELRKKNPNKKKQENAKYYELHKDEIIKQHLEYNNKKKEKNL